MGDHQTQTGTGADKQWKNEAESRGLTTQRLTKTRTQWSRGEAGREGDVWTDKERTQARTVANDAPRNQSMSQKLFRNLTRGRALGTLTKSVADTEIEKIVQRIYLPQTSDRCDSTLDTSVVCDFRIRHVDVTASLFSCSVRMLQYYMVLLFNNRFER